MAKNKSKPLLPVGRKTVVTPEVVRKLEEAFSMDCTDEEACAFAGIGERTYYDHKSSDEQFSQRMERAKRFAFVLAKKTIMIALNKEDGNLALKWLERRQRELYHTKVEQDVKQVPVEEILDQVEENADYPEQFET